MTDAQFGRLIDSLDRIAVALEAIPPKVGEAGEKSRLELTNVVKALKQMPKG